MEQMNALPIQNPRICKKKSFAVNEQTARQTEKASLMTRFRERKRKSERNPYLSPQTFSTHTIADVFKTTR